MIIARADSSDIAEVAKLHGHAFPNFFLTSLGFSFLEELYTGFLSHPSGIFLVAKEEGRIVGFATGTSTPNFFFSDLRRRRQFVFVRKALPSILRNPLPVFKKLLYALRYSGEVPVTSLSGALLSSIGIESVYRGTGLAARLIAAFENEAIALGADFVYLTTDAEDNDRVNAFYRRHGYSAVCCFQQNGRRNMFRYEKRFFE